MEKKVFFAKHPIYDNAIFTQQVRCHMSLSHNCINFGHMNAYIYLF